MTDATDMAQERQLAEMQSIHESARLPVQGLISAAHCDYCGDEIPQGRRVALPGVRMCVGCQQEAEAEAAARIVQLRPRERKW